MTFKKAGVQPPTTWDQFVDISKKIKETGKLPLVVGVQDNFAGGWMMGNILQAAAGYDFMTKLIYSDAKWTDPSIGKGFTALKMFVDEGIISKDSLAINWTATRTAFANDQAAMMVSMQGHALTITGDMK